MSLFLVVLLLSFTIVAPRFSGTPPANLNNFSQENGAELGLPQLATVQASQTSLAGTRDTPPHTDAGALTTSVAGALHSTPVGKGMLLLADVGSFLLVCFLGCFFGVLVFSYFIHNRSLFEIAHIVAKE